MGCALIYSFENMRGKELSQFVSTHEAAASLGYTVQHTRLLARQGRLRATKFARDWLIVRESVARYRATHLWPESDRAVLDNRKIVNVASVPMRSPFRYPGGKTWLVPCIRRWLRSRAQDVVELVEPFAGGAVVALTAVFEGFVQRATLVELDEDVASVWQVVFGGQAPALAKRIVDFELAPGNVRRALAGANGSRLDRAFATILRNRINRGGILAPGAGVVKQGENGRGLLSRWYPATLRKRLLNIHSYRHGFRIICADGIGVMEENAPRTDVIYFIDPPYTVAGRRLYRHSEISHERLFEVAKRLSGDFLITYDAADEIRQLALRHGMELREVLMKNTHHAKKVELLIGRDLSWYDE